MQATKDPFARINKPWNTNTTDFIASSDEAQKVGHVPLPVHEIGLGAFFEEAFDRAMVGRRQVFREGEPGYPGLLQAHRVSLASCVQNDLN